MSTAKRLMTRARLEGLAITLVALGYLWQTRNIPALFQMPGVPGPAAFPTVLGLALGLAGVWRLLRGEATPEGEEEAGEETAQAGAGGARGWVAAHGRFYGLWAVLLGYFVFMPELGFPVGSALALAAMGRLLGERRWPVLAGGAIVVTAVLHLLFAKGLGVRLPLGLLSFLG